LDYFKAIIFGFNVLFLFVAIQKIIF